MRCPRYGASTAMSTMTSTWETYSSSFSVSCCAMDDTSERSAEM